MSKMNLTIAMTAVTIMMMLAGCGEMKKAISPCMNNKYETDKKFYRVRHTGQSVMEEAAYDQAKNNARAELALQIKDHVKLVNERFLEDYHINVAEDLKNKFTNLTLQIVDVVLYDSYIICQEPYIHRKENYYKYWVVVEMSKENYINKLKQEVSEDDELRTNFDLEEFQKKYYEYLH